MKKPRRILFALVAAGALLLTACGTPEPGEQPTEQPTEQPSPEPAEFALDNLEIGSGSVGGAFYVIGAALAQVLEEEFDVPASSTPTEGAAENIRLLDQERIPLGLAAATQVYMAWEGLEAYEKKYENLRLVAYLYPNLSYFYALPSSGLQKVSDLTGRRVVVGTGPTTWDPIMRPVLTAHGLDYDEGIDKVYASFGDAANQVRDRLVDAALTSVPVPADKQLAASMDLVYLEWDPAALEAAIEELPAFKTGTIPPEALSPRYTGDPLLGLDVGGPYLVVRADVPEDVVYRMTKAIHENLPQIAENVAALRDVAADPQIATLRTGDVPFHPGAIRYWQEAGVWQD